VTATKLPTLSCRSRRVMAEGVVLVIQRDLLKLSKENEAHERHERKNGKQENWPKCRF
jgi:hypothetical protein